MKKHKKKCWQLVTSYVSSKGGWLMECKIKCKNFEKEDDKGNCKNFIGYSIIGRADGKEFVLKERCKNRCKYIDNKLEKLEGLKRGWYDLLLSRVNEIVLIAKIYMIVYKLEPIQAIERAIQEIEEYYKEAE